jgi:hypothetical protein
MKKAYWGAALSAAWLSSAFAQAPSTPSPVSPGGATTSIIDQEKRGSTAQMPTQRNSGTRPGTAPLPMNIKIHQEGIKMPACTAESRDGDACKK